MSSFPIVDLRNTLERLQPGCEPNDALHSITLRSQDGGIGIECIRGRTIWPNGETGLHSALVTCFEYQRNFGDGRFLSVYPRPHALSISLCFRVFVPGFPGLFDPSTSDPSDIVKWVLDQEDAIEELQPYVIVEPVSKMANFLATFAKQFGTGGLVGTLRILCNQNEDFIEHPVYSETEVVFIT